MLDTGYFENLYNNKREALYYARIFGISFGLDDLIRQGEDALRESLSLGYNDAGRLLQISNKLHYKETSEHDKQEIINLF